MIRGILELADCLVSLGPASATTCDDREFLVFIYVLDNNTKVEFKLG